MCVSNKNLQKREELKQMKLYKQNGVTLYPVCNIDKQHKLVTINYYFQNLLSEAMYQPNSSNKIDKFEKLINETQEAIEIFDNSFIDDKTNLVYASYVDGLKIKKSLQLYLEIIENK